MSERLTRSFEAFVQSLRMSRHELFVFVEGDTDFFIYNKIAEVECNNNRVRYEVVKSQQLAGEGGKQTLLDYFDYVKSKNLLIDEFQGKRTASIFFLDKDIDEYCKVQRHSPHVLYTDYYEVENYMFRCCDISRAVALVVSAKETVIQEMIGDYDRWRRDCADLWEQWVELCFFSKVYLNGTICSYGENCSKINDGVLGKVAVTELAKYWEQIKERSCLGERQFSTVKRKAAKVVKRLYEKDAHDTVFKGKWYIRFLQELISNKFNRRLDEKSVVTALRACLDLDTPWTRRYRHVIQSLSSQIKTN